MHSGAKKKKEKQIAIQMTPLDCQLLSFSKYDYLHPSYVFHQSLNYSA